MKVFNINWSDESGNKEVGTALFINRELAELYVERMLAPMDDGNIYEVGELLVVTEL